MKALGIAFFFGLNSLCSNIHITFFINVKCHRIAFPQGPINAKSISYDCQSYDAILFFVFLKVFKKNF